MEINCSVTIMPICEPTGEMGFIRRDKQDSYGGLLVAPGGRIEPKDGEVFEGVMYGSVEHAAVRELLEEASIKTDIHQFSYFCSMTLPNGRVVISLYLMLQEKQGVLEWYDMEHIRARNDFAPGMKDEALQLLEAEYGV